MSQAPGVMAPLANRSSYPASAALRDLAIHPSYWVASKEVSLDYHHIHIYQIIMWFLMVAAFLQVRQQQPRLDAHTTGQPEARTKRAFLGSHGNNSNLPRQPLGSLERGYRYRY